MAELMVAGVADKLIRRLTELQLRPRGDGLPEEALQFFLGEKKKVEEILRELGRLAPDVLHEHVKLWAHKAMDVPYLIEDVLDDLDLGFFHCLPIKMEQLRELIKEIAELYRMYMRDLDLIPGRMTCRDPRLSEWYYRDSTELVGIDEPCCQLIKMLTEGQAATKQQMKIVSVVGFAGLGKTSLAKMVYQKLEAQFDCAAFVSVSPAANMEAIFSDMLRQLDRKDNHHEEATSDQTKLAAAETRTFLDNKRYLIVIDDLWNIEDWNNISPSLPNNYCGSRVITTTRISDVAKACCSGRDKLIYEMKNLGDIYSRRLFLKEFTGSEHSCPDNLYEELLNDILKMCGGIPSAIVSIASSLATDVAEIEDSLDSAWKKMVSPLNSGRYEISGLVNLRTILSLSYFHLSSTNVQACLRYLASCTQSHRIERRKWIKKWSSEGFIPLVEDAHRSGEELANQYFDELINCNVIQPVEYDDCIEGDTYEVPCMMLYVLRLISHESHFVTFLSDSDMTHLDSDPRLLSERIARLLSIQCSADSKRCLYDLSHVRSLTVHGFAKSVLSMDLGHLRVLDIDGCNDLDNTAMENICQMTFLKHLSLKKTQITALPPDVRELTRLETLDVSQTQMTALPPEIGNLTSLETLDVSQTQITTLPPEIRNLMYLETLDVSRTQITALPPEIGNLMSLKTLDASQTQITTLPPEIRNLMYLETLDVSRTQITALPPNIGHPLVLKALDVSQTQITTLPPEIRNLMSLETLDVSRTQITALPPEIGNLPSLETLDVSRTQITALPPEIGNLRSLKTLDVSRTQITALPQEIRNLMSLKTLDVSRTQITALPPEIGGLHNLETLDARKTPLKELPKEVLQLLRLRSLLFGQSSFHVGVKLPAGINQLRSVKVLSAIDSRECSTSVLEELCELEELSDLAIVLHDGPIDKKKNDNLLASIGNIPHLKSLTIYGDSHSTDRFPEQDSNPSDESPASRCFPALKELKVAGRFVKVPGWIAQLTAVTVLEIRVCRLDEETKDMEILGKMTNLRNLALSLLVALPRRPLTISSSVDFSKLEAFTFDCRAPWVIFEEGAMPSLKHLQLRLYAGPEGKTPSGIVHLTNLRKVSLRYFSQYAGSVGISQTIDAVKKEAANHPNLITIFVNGAQEFFPFKETAVL